MEKRFLIFHGEHPGVYDELLALVRLAHGRGRKKIGTKMLFEVGCLNRFLCLLQIAKRAS